jgi:hypothetical protein
MAALSVPEVAWNLCEASLPDELMAQVLESDADERDLVRLRGGRSAPEPSRAYTEQMTTIVCGCPRSNRCPACVDQALMWLGGMASTRGISWAESVAKRHPELLGRQWPKHDGRAAELARSKVDDLCEDPHVVDLLAIEVSEQAARRWRQLQADPGVR